MTQLDLTASKPVPIGKPIWLDILKFYGLGTVLALWFVYWITQSASADTRANGTKLDALGHSLQQHSAEMHVDQARAQAIQEQQLRALIALCRNQAKSSRERELCGAVK